MEQPQDSDDIITTKRDIVGFEQSYEWNIFNKNYVCIGADYN